MISSLIVVVDNPPQLPTAGHVAAKPSAAGAAILTPTAGRARVPIVVQRSFTIERGTFAEFERLSREGIWPYMEARGCKILGLFTNVHGGPSDEVVLLTAYDSMAHWEATRLEDSGEGLTDDLRALLRTAAEAGRERRKLTKVSSTRVLGLATAWVDLGVRPG
ncbi:MAG: NIPSNAP family protein [Tepidiformaceae bacterium]